jgi:uncharacterized iron-regulated membrane protein
MQRARTIVRKAHLWLGLGLGALFALLGLTGSLLVFYQEIDAALHPHIIVENRAPAPGWESPVWSRALNTVRNQWPERTGAWRFESTGKPGALAARYQPPKAGHHGQRIMVWLTPDGAQVLRQEEWGAYAMTWIYDLHMQLQLGDVGCDVIGWTGLGMAVLLLSGLWAWWPRGSWVKALRYKRNAAPSRRLHDLHKLAGLVSLPLLLMLTLTGVMLSLPKQSDAMLTSLFGPVDQTPAPKSVSRPHAPISIDHALAIAHRAMPHGRLAWIEAPGDRTGVYMARIQQPGDPSFRFPHSYVFIDQFSGRIVGIKDRTRFGTASTIDNWLHPLHDGSAGGLPLRLLLALFGLAPAILFVTGILRWRARTKKAGQTALPY